MTETRKSPLSDEALRGLYAGTTPATDHPSEDALATLLEHGTSSEARERVVEHVSRCGECAEVLRHLARCAECPAETGVKPLSGATRSAGSWRLWSGLAAAAAVAALLIWTPRPNVGELKPDAEALRAGAPHGLALLTPSGPQNGHPAAFEWRGLPDALTYRVVVRDVRGEQVYASPALSGTSSPWPAAGTFAPGDYTWQVVARLRTGEETASPLAHFSFR